MRIMRIILTALAVALAVGVVVLYAPLLQKLSYRRFVDKDQEYYAGIARACDLMLKQHPLGTNEILRIESSNTSVPKVISDLSPSRITISTNRVHIMVGVRDFGISWGRREGYTNSWALSAIGGPEKVLYVETKQ